MFHKLPEYSMSFQNVLCVSGMFQNVPECSMSFHNVPWPSMTFYQILLPSIMFHDLLGASLGLCALEKVLGERPGALLRGEGMQRWHMS